LLITFCKSHELTPFAVFLNPSPTLPLNNKGRVKALSHN
jgi:hypothetical protein